MEAEVLIRSRRRCALCFGLKRDIQEKNGQIAHVDQNKNNSNINNLVFLCFEHHDRYDSSTSQSKGITEKELLRYRSSLHDLTDKWAREDSSSNDRVNVSRDPVDSFQLYVSSTGGSMLGSPFMARNRTRDHVVFISDTMIAIDHCNPSIADEIEGHYKKTGGIINFPMRAIKDLLEAQISECFFYINFDIFEGRISRIEFGLNHESDRSGRCYFFDESLNLMPESEYAVETDHADKQAMDDVFSVIGQTPLEFLKCFEI